MSDSVPHDEALRIATIDARYRTIRTAIRTIGWVLAAFFSYKAVGDVSGQTTTISVVVNLILNALVDLRLAFTITLAGACAAWAVAEQILRHRAVRHLAGRNAELELRLDPNRTSSGLPVNGKAHRRKKGS